MSVSDAALDSMTVARLRSESATSTAEKNEALTDFLLSSADLINDLFPDADDLGGGFAATQIEALLNR